MDLFERLEQEMAEAEVTEVSASKEPLATQIVVWVFSICLVVLMVAGTVRLLMVWF